VLEVPVPGRRWVTDVDPSRASAAGPTIEHAETSLHLVRHGTTTWNRQNRYRGRRDVVLDEGGVREARRAAALLRDARLSAVYAGPLQRTIDTARIIADAAELREVRIEPGLVNLDYGAWTGLSPSEAAERDPDAYALYRRRPHVAACPQGEVLTHAIQRFIRAIWRIADAHPGQAVAAVTHGVMIRLALTILVDPQMWTRPVEPTGSVTLLTVGNDRVQVAT
jgi:broad specificity phosphatase PhoE